MFLLSFIFVTVTRGSFSETEPSTSLLVEEAVERTEQSLQEALRRRHEGRLGRIDLSSAMSYVLEPDGELSDLDLEESEDESDPLLNQLKKDMTVIAKTATTNMTYHSFE